MSLEEASNTSAQTAESLPIADSSYRHYDGPLHPRAFRWWTVALAGIRPAVRRWWFWVLVLLSTSPYAFWGFMLFLQSRLGRELEGVMFRSPENQRFALIFWRAYDSSLFWIMVLALVIAAPSVAADNRTNALQIYLSKPVTRLDYLLGKWASVFVVVATAMLLPSLALFAYCLLSYWTEGFLQREPWLLLRVLGAAMITAAGFASIFVGVSAWCRSTMIAAAVSAGLYLGTQVAAAVLWVVLMVRDTATSNVARHVLVGHASIGGVISGLVWNAYGVVVPLPMRRGGPFEIVMVSAPSLWVMLAAYVAVVFLGIWAAYVRIRAVEVVSS